MTSKVLRKVFKSRRDSSVDKYLRSLGNTYLEVPGSSSVVSLIFE